LQLVTDLEKHDDFRSKDKDFLHFLKGGVLYFLGRLQESLTIAEQEYLEGKRLNKHLYSIDMVFLKFANFVLLNRVSEVWEDVDFCETLLKSELHETPSEINLRKGFVYMMRGYYFWYENNYDKALKHLKQSLAILENFKIFSFVLPFIWDQLGIIYTTKGELELALTFYEKYSVLSKGSGYLNKLIIAGNLRSIGAIYFQQGELDRAIENLQKSLEISKKMYLPIHVTWAYFILIHVFLEKKSPKQAKEYLDHFYHYIEKKRIPKDKLEYQWYSLSKARLLKSSTRIRERAEAEKILKDLIEEHDVAKLREDNLVPIPEEIPEVLIELCDFYFEELRLTNDLKILDDIQPFLARLLKESKRVKSYTLQAHTNLLYGKISLLQMNMGEARRYIIQAQDIAEDHGLQLLARAISEEHDKLLEQLAEWENFKKRKAPISERMNLVSLNDTIGRMQGKRAIELAESIDEDSILLLILQEGGILLFSYPFTDEWKFDEELFGGFLTAFNSISDEIFSEGLDRVKFGQHTVLMEPVANFSICYLFKGESYIAKQKLTRFANHLQKNASIQQTFDQFFKASQVLEIKDFPFLESLISEVFLSNSSELKT